jgi:hypothetical protein
VPERDTDQRLPAGAQHSGDLGQGLPVTVKPGDVFQGRDRRDTVERFVGERQPTRVAADQLYRPRIDQPRGGGPLAATPLVDQGLVQVECDHVRAGVVANRIGNGLHAPLPTSSDRWSGRACSALIARVYSKPSQ